MAYYQYQCKQCGHSFEQILKIADRLLPEQTPCEKCGGEIQQAILIAPSFKDPWGADLHDKKQVGSDWKEVLSHIHQKNPGSNLDQLL